jgi:hypothetical protein
MCDRPGLSNCGKEEGTTTREGGRKKGEKGRSEKERKR